MRVAGQRLWFHSRQQMLPDQVQLALHVAGFGGDGHDGVLFRHHNHILSERAIAAEGVMPAAPELVTISLEPIVLVVRAAGFGGQRLLDLEAGGLFDPLGGEQLPASPGALLAIQLADLREGFGLNAQAPTANVDAARTGFPGYPPYAQRREQPWLKEVNDLLSGNLLDDGRQH